MANSHDLPAARATETDIAITQAPKKTPNIKVECADALQTLSTKQRPKMYSPVKHTVGEKNMPERLPYTRTESQRELSVTPLSEAEQEYKGEAPGLAVSSEERDGTHFEV
ncbi:hypothetical protein NDU88_004385 [Pleurodeles waltl]|uniref:Uncharacterized protein n=1 Tax=Pleurodeles waltl TaxID=8319 RepID=A0AAV7V1M9_PLEWA|nr:hypothetical protein NDU88_004385 [Pleurodeles waltl]